MLTAIFDIGKTNKKFFLYNENLDLVLKEYQEFPEVTDEDGYPCENLTALCDWMKTTFLKHKDKGITALNFTTYGASLVHLDENGKVLTPLYNYTKEMSPDLELEFYKAHNPSGKFNLETGTIPAGFLNSGLQLYWIKRTKPEVFKKIKTSLHLPQYMAYVFGQNPYTEYTSIGCHTALWNFNTKSYHPWVTDEDLEPLFPPLVPTTHSQQKNLLLGVGIHDSSATLLAYKKGIKGTFALISTGTWSVSMYPFGEFKPQIGTEQIAYMQPDGSPVSSARLFLGKEYAQQVKKLAERYGLDKTFFYQMAADSSIKFREEKYFRWEYLENKVPIKEHPFINAEEAYHQLVYELVNEQMSSLKIACGGELPPRVYVDGGFTENEIFMRLLAKKLGDTLLFASDASAGTAIGAWLCLPHKNLPKNWFQKAFNSTQTLPL